MCLYLFIPLLHFLSLLLCIMCNYSYFFLIHFSWFIVVICRTTKVRKTFILSIIIFACIWDMLVRWIACQTMVQLCSFSTFVQWFSQFLFFVCVHFLDTGISNGSFNTRREHSQRFEAWAKVKQNIHFLLFKRNICVKTHAQAQLNDSTLTEPSGNMTKDWTKKKTAAVRQTWFRLKWDEWCR